MRSDEQIKDEIRRLEFERYHTPSHSPASREIEQQLHKLELELRDPAALLPEIDVREVDRQTER